MADHDALSGPPARITPPRRRRVPPRTDRPESVGPLLSALVAIAAAGDANQVCQAAVTGALEIADARGAAIGALGADDVVLLASVGYECDSMDAGARLPLGAGLPLTECVRTGRGVARRGEGSGGWIALPVSTPMIQAGLLVSLAGWGTVDVQALQTLSDATSDALARCELTKVEPGVLDSPNWLSVAARSAGHGGAAVGGDVVVAVPGAAPDIAWVVVADVCGRGQAAAPTAAAFRVAIEPLAAADISAADLLKAAGRVVGRRTDLYVTATALRIQPDAAGALVEVASAGHPPVLWRGIDYVTPVGSAGTALNLVADEPQSLELEFLRLRPGELLLAHTDGLVDRGPLDLSDLLAEVFVATMADEPQAVADGVVRRIEELAGAPDDDVALAVIGLA